MSEAGRGAGSVLHSVGGARPAARWATLGLLGRRLPPRCPLLMRLLGLVHGTGAVGDHLLLRVHLPQAWAR